MSEHRLCRTSELVEGQSTGFILNPESRYADLIAVRTPSGVYVYRNQCPHTGAPMEWEPDQFLDYTGTLIQCGIHGALFQIRDGYCISGPCIHQSLQPVTVTERDGWVVLLDVPESRV